MVFDITLDTSGIDPVANGGRLHLVDPWQLNEADLRPLTYEYRVPPRDGDDV